MSGRGAGLGPGRGRAAGLFAASFALVAGGALVASSCASRGRAGAPVGLDAAGAAAPPGAAPRAPTPAGHDAAFGASAVPGASAAPGASATLGAGAVPGASGALGVGTGAGASVDAAPAAGGPRAVGLAYPAWIYPNPDRVRGPVGLVRPGTGVALLDAAPRRGKACRGGWLAAAPSGFLCNDDKVSFDPGHPMAAAAIAELVAPSREGVLPYRYAFSRNAPVYGRLPTEAEQDKIEGPAERRPRARKPTKGGFGGHDELTVDEEFEAEAEPPALLAGGRPLPGPDGPAPLVRKWVPEGSTVAFARAFRAGGRTWLISTDLGLVPADRVVAYRTSTFQGVKLEGEARLPLAWARHRARPFYRREAGGWVPTGETLAARASVALTGERVEASKGAYWKVDGPGDKYVSEAEVGLARLHPPPWGLEPGEKWVDVRARDGTLVAYEGPRPVFATLVSVGAGGAGKPEETDAELVAKGATPVGSYRVAWKVGAARMTPEKGEPERFWLAEVPYTLYFRAPFAIHVAYWHEDFGAPKSAGCVNVSPADGKFLFGWADPPLPVNWQGVGPGRATGLGTRVIVAP